MFAPTIVFFMCLAVVLNPAGADWTSVIANYSTPCEMTIRLNAPHLLEEHCSRLNATHEYMTLVRHGFCTENEFNNYIATVCGSSIRTKSDSLAKLHFYNALNKASDKCHWAGLTCMNISVVAILLKEQEQYCALLHWNLIDETFESCVQTLCSLEEFNQIKSAACQKIESEVDQTFSAAILGSRRSCQHQMTRCVEVSPRLIELVHSQRYCDLLYMKDNDISTLQCLEEHNACSTEELGQLKHAACASKAERVAMFYLTRIMTFALCSFIALID